MLSILAFRRNLLKVGKSGQLIMIQNCVKFSIERNLDSWDFFRLKRRADRAIDSRKRI